MTIILPTILPSPEEVRACSEYIPPNLSALWKGLRPETMRTFIYRAIGGDTGWSKLFNILGYQNQLLVLAELNPPVWGVTRDLSNQVWLHNYGACLNCKKELDYIHGTPFPFVNSCLSCYKNGDIMPEPTIFQHSIPTWPVEYQLECINYIIESIKGN